MQSFALAALATSSVGGIATAQMTIGATLGGSGPINNAHNGQIRLQDVVAPLGTTGNSLLFTHQSVLGVDNKWVDGTGGLSASYDYTLLIQIDAPGKCWTLDITNWRKGQFGAYDDGNKGWAHADLGSVTCKVDGVHHPALDLGGGGGQTNTNDKDNDVFMNVDTPKATSSIMGTGSQTISLNYSWSAYVGSTVAFVSGGDEGLILFGLDPTLGGNSEFEHGSNPDPSWGLSTQLTFKAITAPAFLNPCPKNVIACIGAKAVLSAGGIVGDNLTYTWVKVDPFGNVSVVGNQEKLVIVPATVADIGSYTLTISNECGVISACPIFLYVLPCSPFPVWQGAAPFVLSLGPGVSPPVGPAKHGGVLGATLPTAAPLLPSTGPN
ncbi:hypothetical protein [Engelhardtia mirabilis]|uniref:Ig-like domain-containing protein n=1 Tax=Engelhardtia mirabilis TaxID=2528011 RepID=A0A518BEA9_9BACT|nr:hypothetical protein Pla133_03760 [Planctomycetes bacterium Pla133]QDU99637.1 hypothetical protein Pla86_03760 [Planctomycetes bacterium Pla86]